MSEINPISDEETMRQESNTNAPTALPVDAPEDQPQSSVVEAEQPSSVTAPVQKDFPPQAVSEKLLTKLRFIKRMFFLTLIGCVGAAAIVSVVAILMGEFSSAVWKTIMVILSMAVHVFIILGYTSALFKQEDKTGKSAFTITNVALFSIFVISFIVTILSIWDVISSDMALRSYGAMFIVMVAAIHSDVLYNLRNFSKALNAVIALNFVFIVAVAGMLATALLGAGEGWALLGQDAFFWRLLGAAGVIDASLTVISAIMLKMWQQAHPELVAQSGGGAVRIGPIAIKSLIALIILVIFWPVILVILGILWFFIGAVASPFLLLV